MASMITAEQAKARAPIAAMTGLVDLQRWDALGDCFAERVTVDYTSLWGGEPQEIGRDELIDQWKALLPGFDATRHELGEVEVTVRGDSAEARAPVSGTHILGGDAWVVEGRYEVALGREGSAWRITALRYANERESGDRGLTEEAKRRAAEK